MKRILILGAAVAAVVAAGAWGVTKLTTDQANIVAAPVAINLAGVSAANGTSRSFATADHVHSITGTLGATNGGTSQSTYATGDILYASAANTLSKLAKATNDGAILYQNVSIPAWLPRAGANGALLYQNSSLPAWLAAATNGQVLTLAGGLPAWAGDTSWTTPTLINGFAATASFMAPGYFKDASGFVHLRGNATNSAGTAAGNPLFTLPVGFRPSARVVYAAPSGTVTTTFTRVDVDSSGNVFNVNATAAGAYVAIDGMTFDTR